MLWLTECEDPSLFLGLLTGLLWTGVPLFLCSGRRSVLLVTRLESRA